MSDTEDQDSRTEEATEKKLNDTIAKGNLPISRDVGAVTLFLSFLFSAYFLFDNIGGRLIASLGLMLASVGEISFRNASDAKHYFNVISLEVARFVTPLLVMFVLAGLVASFVQGVPRFVVDRIVPNLSRISIVEGSKRMLRVQNAIEFVKALFKIAFVATALTFSLYVDHNALIDSMRIEPRLITGTAISLVVHLIAVLCIPLTVLVIGDVIWVRIKWRRDIRMSRQEIKDEFRQAEGDPIMKARLRSLAMDRSRKRMIASVPRATFVITNPTHYAIALRYVREEGGAPLVVAKGKNIIALKIREVAERHNVPVFEKKALARSMFDHVEIDRMIPSEFYKPVAQLIHFLNSSNAASQN
jgi:flagellar biosynthetic protein FlhB